MPQENLTRRHLRALRKETAKPAARHRDQSPPQAGHGTLVRGGGDASRRQGGEDQVIAANLDLAVVICSPASPPFRANFVDRYLVAASRDGLTPLLCLTKVDLGVSAGVDAELEGFARLGITVLRTSTTDGTGIAELRAAIEAKTSVFTGHSGVGKSSLLNALVPGLGLQVGAVTEKRAGQGKGRHTTTAARLIPIGRGTFVVDSPGIRMFGIRNIARDHLDRYFPDFWALAGGCAFRGCGHDGEEGCAVAIEAENNPFLLRRLLSYRRIRAELDDRSQWTR